MNEIKKHQILFNSIFISVLLIIYILIFTISYEKGLSFAYDSYKEFIIPDQIIKGKILYKDIFCLYFPNTYLLNALLFKLFGNSLKVLSFASFFICSIFLIYIYKLMKEISTPSIGFISALSVLLMCISRTHESNFASYFYPYSFSIIYSFTSCIISVYYSILYIKYKNLRYLYISSFLLGVAISFKIDFFFISIIILFLLIKTKSIKIIFRTLLIGLIPILLSILIFYLHTGRDFFNITIYEINTIHKYFNNPFVITFYKNQILPLLNYELLSDIFYSFIQFIKIFSAGFLTTGILYFTYLKVKNKNILVFLTIILLCIMFYITKYTEINTNIFKYLFEKSGLYLYKNFIFLPYLLILLSILIIIFKKLNKINYNEKYTYYIILLVSAFAIAGRDYALIYISNIGNYTVVLYWLTFIYLIIEIFPQIFNLFNNKHFKRIFCISLIIYSYTFLFQYIQLTNQMNHKFVFNKGNMYVSETFYPIINKAVTHAKENIKDKNKTLLYLDEGTYLHYYLDIPVIDLNLYALHDFHVPILGEEYIIKILKEKQPDYIYKYVPPKEIFSHYEFGISYAQKIYKYIIDNYNLESKTEVKGPFDYTKQTLYIFKRKS